MAILLATPITPKRLLKITVLHPQLASRGIVATIDGDGKNVVLLWLFDNRGGYALLMIDAETGKSEEFTMPFPLGGDTPRYIATDDTGWVYFGLGETTSQIIAFNPETKETKPMLEESERKRGIAFVYRDKNGKVYGQPLPGKNEAWYEFYQGLRRSISDHTSNPVHIITDSQALFHKKFPDGKTIEVCDLVTGRLVVSSKKVKFTYTREGAHIMGVGTILMEK